LVANPSAIQSQLSKLVTNALSESQIRQIIGHCRDIPVGIQGASLTCVNERVLDKPVFLSITSQAPSGQPDGDWAARLSHRKENLKKHVGNLLICVFIRLPGVHYTIEIDPSSASVVHWEWQQI
jgi:hypothetical protein